MCIRDRVGPARGQAHARLEPDMVESRGFARVGAPHAIGLGTIVDLAIETGAIEDDVAAHDKGRERRTPEHMRIRGGIDDGRGGVLGVGCAEGMRAHVPTGDVNVFECGVTIEERCV